MVVVDPLFQVIRGHYTPLNEVVLEELNLPGLTELRGSWHGSLDASGGGNGDTMVYIFPILARVQISNIKYHFSREFSYEYQNCKEIGNHFLDNWMLGHK